MLNSKTESHENTNFLKAELRMMTIFFGDLLDPDQRHFNQWTNVRDESLFQESS